MLYVGSGSDLSLPLLMAKRVICVTASDINVLADEYLINNMAHRIGHASIEEIGLDYVVYSPPTLPFASESF